jgi:hypothetical protein
MLLKDEKAFGVRSVGDPRHLGASSQWSVMASMTPWYVAFASPTPIIFIFPQALTVADVGIAIGSGSRFYT